RSATRKLQAALRELQTRGPRYEQAFEPALEQLQNISDLCQQRGQAVDARLAEVEPAFFADLTALMRGLKRDANPPEVTAEGLPPILRSRYVGTNPQGETLYALYVYPAKNVWERELAAEFNAALLAVDPQATGV